MNCTCQASLSFTLSWGLLRFLSTVSVMLSNYLILCHPLLLSLTFPSIRIFSSESVLFIRWPKYESFSFSIHPLSEYSGLISFRMDWLYLLAVQGTLKSLLPHHSSKSSTLQHSAFFMVQLSLPSGFSGGSDSKVSACNVGDRGLIPGLGRSLREGNGNSLQYSCLKNSMGGGAYWATVHGVIKSQIWLSNFICSN